MEACIARGNAAVAAMGATQDPEDLREVEAFDLLKSIRDMLAASARSAQHCQPGAGAGAGPVQPALALPLDYFDPCLLPFLTLLCFSSPSDPHLLLCFNPRMPVVYGGLACVQG